MAKLKRISEPGEELIGEKVAKFNFVYEIDNVSDAFTEDASFCIRDHGIRVQLKMFSYYYATTSNRRKYTLKFFNYDYFNASQAIYLTCPEFEIKNASICEYGHFIRTKEFPNGTLQFSITVEIQPEPRKPMTTMYEDTEIADFELCAEDGSVKVHKVVLAIASPVFKAMLINDWKEKTEGRVEVPETTKETLEFLKKYMYVHTIDKNVSTENLLQLLRLATYYMMPDLEEDCSRLIEEKITGQNIWLVLNTVILNKYEKLLVMILQNMNNNKIRAIAKDFANKDAAAK